VSAPDEIKWTTHRPVILAAPDWPEMVELKAHAANLRADVEISPLIRSKHCQVVWVPVEFVGSAATRLERQYAEALAGSLNQVVHAMGRLAGVAQGLSQTMRGLADAAGQGDE
jgi:hypothetical protein